MLNEKNTEVTREAKNNSDQLKVDGASRALSHEETAKIEQFLDKTDKSNDDWARRVQEQAHNELRKLREQRDAYLQKLAPESDRHGEPLLDHNRLDGLLGSLLRNNQNGEFDELIIATCEAFLRVSLYERSWNHSVCHNFENEDVNLLQGDKFFDVAARLVEQGAKRALLGDGCFDRILRGVISYNEQCISAETLHKPFLLKPEILNDEQIQRRFPYPFITTSTPYEYLMARVNAELASTAELRRPPIPLSLLELLRCEESNAVLDEYIGKRYAAKNGEISGNEVLKGYRKATSSDSTPGVFVDVDDTLIRRGDTLYQPLVDALDALCPRSDGVIVFTGGDSEALTTTLREAGFPERFLPVRAKSDFLGQRLSLLIDDTPAESQGLVCDERIEPVEAVERLKEIDPQGAIETYRATKG
jgi:hypothetical protein